jgi:hypothetical protein
VACNSIWIIATAQPKDTPWYNGVLRLTIVLSEINKQYSTIAPNKSVMGKPSSTEN